MRAWKPRALQLARSQPAAALLGLAIAQGFWCALPTQSVLDAITRLPLEFAARLAFHFGAEEHARALLIDLERTPGGEELTRFDDAVIELKLGALDAEQYRTDQSTPHLDAAVQACREAQANEGGGENPYCTPAKLRAMMVEVAATRLVSPSR